MPSAIAAEAFRFRAKWIRNPGSSFRLLQGRRHEHWAMRFLASVDFLRALAHIPGYVPVEHIIDRGADACVTSFALGRCGVEMIYSLDPSSRDIHGKDDIKRVMRDPQYRKIVAIGEQAPLQSGLTELVYSRQVPHNAIILSLMVREYFCTLSSRVVLFTCRDHVANNKGQQQKFLISQPTQAAVVGESAFKLSEFLGAIRSAGLCIRLVLGSFDSLIKAHPAVRNSEELAKLLAKILRRKLGLVGLRWLICHW